MDITSLMVDSSEYVYSSHGFKIMLEMHLTYLKNTNTSAFTITQQQSHKFEGDLYGLFNELKIPSVYHYIIMRVNGYESSSDYKGDIIEFIMPDLNEIHLLANIYQTKNR